MSSGSLMQNESNAESSLGSLSTLLSLCVKSPLVLYPTNEYFREAAKYRLHCKHRLLTLISDIKYSSYSDAMS